MFMRESAGVYEFGSRRVSVQVSRGSIQIKVGGGFLSIDEFLDQYTPVELEKLERRDPLKRFSEKVAVQKTIGDKPAVENMPVKNIKPKSAIKRQPIAAKSIKQSQSSRSVSNRESALRQSCPEQIFTNQKIETSAFNIKANKNIVVAPLSPAENYDSNQRSEERKRQIETEDSVEPMARPAP